MVRNGVLEVFGGGRLKEIVRKKAAKSADAAGMRPKERVRELELEQCSQTLS